MPKYHSPFIKEAPVFFSSAPPPHEQTPPQRDVGVSIPSHLSDFLHASCLRLPALHVFLKPSVSFVPMIPAKSNIPTRNVATLAASSGATATNRVLTSGASGITKSGTGGSVIAGHWKMIAVSWAPTYQRYIGSVDAPQHNISNCAHLRAAIVLLEQRNPSLNRTHLSTAPP